MNGIACPYCGSTNLTKSSAIYEQGTQQSKGGAVGVGLFGSGIGFGAATTSSQSISLAAQKNAPPKSAFELVIGTFVAVFIFTEVAGIVAGFGFLNTLLICFIISTAAAFGIGILIRNDPQVQAYNNQWYCMNCGQLCVIQHRETSALTDLKMNLPGSPSAPLVTETQSAPSEIEKHQFPPGKKIQTRITDERSWITSAANALHRVSTGKSDFCIFRSGELYLQFAPLTASQLTCEAISGLYSKRAHDLIDVSKSNALLKLGFSADLSDNGGNYIQYFDINPKYDYQRCARFVLQVFEEIYDVKGCQLVSIELG